MTTGTKRTRVDCLDLEIDDLALSDIHEMVDAARESGEFGKLILAMNPEKLSLLERHPALVPLYRAADVILPDGVGVRVAARLLAKRRVRRITGADLMLELVSYAAAQGHSVALIGSSEATNEKTAKTLVTRFPGLRVVFRHHGYFSDNEAPALLAGIAQTRPNITFIGLGSPRQELFVAQYRHELRTNIIQCVGGTFDTIAGTVKRAPQVFQKAGCEWLYRLIRQPTRVARYGRLVKFSFRLLREIAKNQPSPVSAR